MQYKVGDMLFARCQNYPYWPGKVLACFPITLSYKVLFYGEKSQANIDQKNILPFTDQACRRICNQPSNRNNKQLKRSINIAIKKFHRRRNGQVSSSEDDDIFQQSEPYKRTENEVHKKKTHNIQTTIKYEDPHLELYRLLESFTRQASIPVQTKQRVRDFTKEDETKLVSLLQPESNLSLSRLIELKVIEKFIVALKAMKIWKTESLSGLAQLIKERYEVYKSQILSEQFAQNYNISASRRETIIHKVKINKAAL